MMMAPPKRKLRNYLLDPRYQLKFVLLPVGTFLLGSLGAGWIFFQQSLALTDALRTYQAVSPDIHELMAWNMRTTCLVVAGISVVVAPGIGFLALVMSHRTAGPLLRFHRVFTQ